VNVNGLIATGVNADGKREILGFEVTSAEDGASWLAFFRGLVAQGLSRVVLAASDAHTGLVAAIAASCGRQLQRCRTIRRPSDYADLTAGPLVAAGQVAETSA